MLHKTIQGLLIAAAASAVALGLGGAAWVQHLEARTWDIRVSALWKREQASDRIALVFLDQGSLDWGSRQMHWPWPWPRVAYTPLIDACRRGGAASVAFDVLYSEPSINGVEDDDALGASIRDSGRFVGALMLGTEAGSSTRWPAEIPAPGVRLVDLDGSLSSLAAALTLPQALPPIPEVATNAALLANVGSNPDPDGIYRRVPLFALFDGHVVPSLGLACYLTGLEDKTLTISNGILRVGAARVSLDRQGRALLRYRGPSQSHAAASAAHVIQEELKARAQTAEPASLPPFKGRHVLFGFTAPGLFDLRSSPISAVYPGVEVHATVLDNLLGNDFMRDAPSRLVTALILALAAAAGILTRLCRNAIQTMIVFAVLLPLPLLLGFYAYGRGLWLPIVLPTLAVAPALVGGLVMNYATEGRQKRFIKTAFRHYLSPEVIDQLVLNPGLLKLGGERRELSILFSDIQGFTGISESMDPVSLTGFLNEYLTAMTDLIYEEGGTVDKYEGDAIIAFWNAPLPQSDHARHAVTAALRCQAKLTELRPRFREKAGRDIHARVGVNTGDVVVGNMGSSQRFNYTFLGDAGNLASRLEGINKQFGTYVLISKATRDRMGDLVAAREIGRVGVVGRGEPVTVFEPFFPDIAAQRRHALDVFASGLQAFYAGRFDEARAHFESIAADDPPAARYAERCRTLAASPLPGWEGVIRMTEK